MSVFVPCVWFSIVRKCQRTAFSIDIFPLLQLTFLINYSHEFFPQVSVLALFVVGGVINFQKSDSGNSFGIMIFWEYQEANILDKCLFSN